MRYRGVVCCYRVMAVVFVGVFAVTWSCEAANFYAQVESKHGKRVSKSSVYVRGNKVRQESKVDGEERVTIVRGDLNLTWQLFPEKKEYKETKGARLYAPDPEELKKFSEAKETGKETIAGYLCTKTVYTPREENGPTITVWMSVALKWPLKVQIALPGNTVVSEYKKIKTMTAGKELFELPPDYRPIEPQPKDKKAD